MRSLLPCLLAVMVAAAEGDPLLWQLGREDGRNAEFLPFSSKEFKVSQAVLSHPGFDRRRHALVWQVPGPGLHERPAFPGGISGEGAANASWVAREALEWQDDGEGGRTFEAVVLPSGAWRFDQQKLNENCDYDDRVRLDRALRVRGPGGATAWLALPYQLAGPVSVRLHFAPAAGINRIELEETSGATYGRCYHWDMLRLVRGGRGADANPPSLEVLPGGGFAVGAVWQRGGRPRATVAVRNLAPGAAATVVASLTDFFGACETRRLPFTAGADGAADLALDLPGERTGALRVAARLERDGAVLPLQLGLAEAELRAGGVRAIAPAAAAEVDGALFGLCGLAPTIFDPYPDEAFLGDKVAHYRAWRELLQVRHERLHSLYWPWLEPVAGERRWAFWDRLVAGEHAAGIRLQLALLGQPEWMARTRMPGRPYLWQGLYGMPDPEAWAGLCAEVARRWRGQVAEFEVWNEPSAFSLFWSERTPEAYAELIRRAAQAVRAEAPGMRVVAQTVWARQLEFCRRLYELGAGEWVDHPADHYWRDDRLEQVNRLLDRVGRGRGLYCNEAKSGLRDGVGERSEADRQRSARMFLRNLLYGHAHGVVRSYEFLLISPTHRLYGLVGPDGSPKHTFFAAKTVINRTAGARLLRWFRPTAGVEAWLYAWDDPLRRAENGGAAMLVLCNGAAAPARVDLAVGGQALTRIDLMDNPAPLAAADGRLALELGADPLLVVGVDPAAVLAEAALVAGASGLECAPGASAAVTLALDGATAARLTLAGPAGEVAVELGDGGRRTVAVPVPAHQGEGGLDLVLAGTVEREGHRSAVRRVLPLLVTATPLHRNLLGDRPCAGGALQRWGDPGGCVVAGDGRSATWDLPATGTAGYGTARPVAVIAGRTYLVAAELSGVGSAHAHLGWHRADGSLIEVDHGFFRTELGDLATALARRVTVPEGAAGLSLHLLFHQGRGRMTVAEPRIERVPADEPVNRSRFRTRARLPAGDPWTALEAGAGPAWGHGQGVRMEGWSGPADCSARALLTVEDGVLVLRCAVRDDADRTAADPARLWESDSLQIGFLPDPASAAQCQFGIGRHQGRVVVQRYLTVPSEDIVPSYRPGPDPAGVEAAVERLDGTTRYTVRFAAGAIWPNLVLEPGSSLGLSLLVNDDDAGRRKGWIEWAGGIGDHAEGDRFGTLILDHRP